MITTLEEFKAYNLAMKIGEEIWAIVSKWNYFEKDTVGKQLVRTADSIAANLSEGLGRYHFKEARNFSYYSRGSLFETRTWLSKSRNRNLVSEEDFKRINQSLDEIGRMLNAYINSIGSSTVGEPIENYGDNKLPNALMPNAIIPNT